MSRHDLAALTADLLRRDPALAPVLREAVPVRKRRDPDLYLDLLEAILAQQLSGRAAATITARFKALFPDGHPAPDLLAGMSPDQLRPAGVSRQKAGYLVNVACFAREHDLSARALRGLTDEDLIRRLTQIKGVGRWTVEMLLMFTLGRPDVMPVDDLGIQNAMIRLYRLRSRGRALRVRMFALSEAWRPHRTFVCRNLWRWLST